MTAWSATSTATGTSSGDDPTANLDTIQREKGCGECGEAEGSKCRKKREEWGSVASWPRRTSTAAVATAQHALLAVHGELRGVSEGVGWCGVRRGCGGGFIARDAAYGGRSARRRPWRHGGDISPQSDAAVRGTWRRGVHRGPDVF